MAAARVNLGLSAAEFWDLTPYHVHILWKHYHERRREEYRPFAMLAALYVNCNRREGTDPVEIETFMPQAPSKVQTGDNQITEDERKAVIAHQKAQLLQWARSQPGAIRRTRDAA